MTLTMISCTAGSYSGCVSLFLRSGLDYQDAGAIVATSLYIVVC